MLELQWEKDDNNEKTYIICDNINTKIEINPTTKEVSNINGFFQEVIYNMFFTNKVDKISLSESDYEVSEIKSIIGEIIEICNDEIDKGLNTQEEKTEETNE